MAGAVDRGTEADGLVFILEVEPSGLCDGRDVEGGHIHVCMCV